MSQGVSHRVRRLRRAGPPSLRSAQVGRSRLRQHLLAHPRCLRWPPRLRRSGRLAPLLQPLSLAVRLPSEGNAHLHGPKQCLCILWWEVCCASQGCHVTYDTEALS